MNKDNVGMCGRPEDKDLTAQIEQEKRDTASRNTYKAGTARKKPPVPKQPFLVVCYDSDHQLAHLELIDARSAAAATQTVFWKVDARNDCTWHVATFSREQLAGLIADMDANAMGELAGVCFQG